MLSGYYESLHSYGFTGQQTKNIPYHFTLGSYGTEHGDRLIRELDSIAGSTPAIEICLGYIGLFGLRVLFIAPNMNFELLSLQKSFFTNCGNECHPWAAHATILLDESDIITKAVPALAEIFKPRKARIESIGLWEFQPARLIKKCKLTG